MERIISNIVFLPMKGFLLITIILIKSYLLITFDMVDPPYEQMIFKYVKPVLRYVIEKFSFGMPFTLEFHISYMLKPHQKTFV